MQGSVMETPSTSTNECNSRGPGIEGSNSWLMLKVHVGLILVQFCYAGSYVLNRVALTNGVNPIVFAVYRDALCMIVLAPIALFFERRKRPPLTFKLIALVVVAGFIGFKTFAFFVLRPTQGELIFEGCYFRHASCNAPILGKFDHGFILHRAYITQMFSLFGVAYTSAAYGSTISILAPLFTFIISAVFRLEEIRWNRRDGQAKVGGLICAICGALILGVYLGPVILGQEEVVVDPPMSDLEPSRSLLTLMPTYLRMGRWQLGVTLLFLAGFTLSLTLSLQVPVLKIYPSPIAVSMNTYFVGALMLFVTAIITVHDWSEFVLTEKSVVISYVYNAIAPAAFSFTVLIWSVKHAGPVLVAAYIPLQIFASYSMAYVFLGESIYLGSVLGAILIITGLGFITWGQVEHRAGVFIPVKAVPPLEGVSASTAIAVGVEEPLLG